MRSVDNVINNATVDDIGFKSIKLKSLYNDQIKT